MLWRLSFLLVLMLRGKMERMRCRNRWILSFERQCLSIPGLFLDSTDSTLNLPSGCYADYHLHTPKTHEFLSKHQYLTRKSTLAPYQQPINTTSRHTHLDTISNPHKCILTPGMKTILQSLKTLIIFFTTFIFICDCHLKPLHYYFTSFRGLHTCVGF
jgi:hypothetical protein